MKFPKFLKIKWNFSFKRSTSTRLNFEEDPYTFDEGEIIRVYNTFSKSKKDNARASSPLQHKIGTNGGTSSIKALALLYPILIPAWLAWDNLKKAILDINRAKAFKTLHLIGLDNHPRRYLVKRGLWGAASTRMFFAGAPGGKLKRYTIITTETGYPGVCENGIGTPWEVRIIKVSAPPANTCDPQSEQPSEQISLEVVSPNGQLPLWAQQILETAREYKRFMDQHQDSETTSLLEIAKTSHTTACSILSLDDNKKPLLRKEVQKAYKIRMNIVHPDKITDPNIDTRDVVHALIWAKHFLTPL